MSESTEQTDLFIRAITAFGVFMAGFKGLASLFTMAGKGLTLLGKVRRRFRARKARARRSRW